MTNGTFARIAGALALAALTLTGCTSTGFPTVGEKGKVAIVAHRGFWNCEAAGYTENSIASLKAAQDAGVWGSEFDVQLTSDNVAIINHNKDIQGVVIEENPYEVFQVMTLANGEHPSTIDEYLAQGALCTSTVLVCELKPQSTEEKEDILWEVVSKSLREHNLFTPERVIFISFSKHLCDLVALEAPEFVNQYLKGDIAPTQLAEEGINGIDYSDKKFNKNPGYIEEAHSLGMSVNVWTINEAESMQAFFEAGVDALTTNEPLLARELLGEKEFKLSE